MAAAAPSVMELVEYQPRIWNHTLGYVSTMTVQCAVELEIPDVIQAHGRPMTLHELLSALQIPPAKAQFLSRLMRVLVHLGYFSDADQEGGGPYSLAPLSRFLLKETPLNGRSMFLLTADPIMVDSWRHMSAWFRDNTTVGAGGRPSPPFAFAHGGKKMYDVAASDPKFSELLNDGVGSDSELLGRALVSTCQKAFEGVRSFVDVGGNIGITAKVVADAFPQMEVTVFDLPRVVDGLEDAGRPNLKFVGGDMFKEIPQTDAVFLKWVLVDWGNDSVVEILKQCKKAVTASGGKVMIAENVLGHESCNDHFSTTTLLFTDMSAMGSVEGTVRSEKEWSKLFIEAGFSRYTMTPIAALRVLIEAYP